MANIDISESYRAFKSLVPKMGGTAPLEVVRAFKGALKGTGTLEGRYRWLEGQKAFSVLYKFPEDSFIILRLSV